jgi:tetratricopeptide (TPR) repeat protein
MIDEWELAIDAFKHALADQPTFVDAVHQLAVSYNSTERYADAMECSKRALQPGFAEAHNNLAVLYFSVVSDRWLWNSTSCSNR